MTDKHLAFEDFAEFKGGRWIPKARVIDGVKHTESQATIDDMARFWSALTVMRDSFQKHGVERFALLTCNVGSFPKECQKLANLIKTTVVAYTGFITAQIIPDLPEPPFPDPEKTKNRMRAVPLWVDRRRKSPPPSDPLLEHLMKWEANGKSFNEHLWALKNYKKHPLFVFPPPNLAVAFEPRKSTIGP